MHTPKFVIAHPKRPFFRYGGVRTPPHTPPRSITELEGLLEILLKFCLLSCLFNKAFEVSVSFVSKNFFNLLFSLMNAITKSYGNIAHLPSPYLSQVQSGRWPKVKLTSPMLKLLPEFMLRFISSCQMKRILEKRQNLFLKQLLLDLVS